MKALFYLLTTKFHQPFLLSFCNKMLLQSIYLSILSTFNFPNQHGKVKVNFIKIKPTQKLDHVLNLIMITLLQLCNANFSPNTCSKE